MLANSYVAKRHELAKLRPNSAWKAVEADSKDRIEQWLAQDFPTIVTRLQGDEPNGYFRLGIPLPLAENKKRLSLIVARKAVIELNAAPYLIEVIPKVSKRWQLAMIDLLIKAQTLNLMPRVYGSFLWQAITGCDYVTPTSDLDLIWKPTSINQIDKLFVMLSTWEVKTGLLADGEVIMPDGAAVCWRELASTANNVLVKTYNSVSLRKKQDVLNSLIKKTAKVATKPDKYYIPNIILGNELSVRIGSIAIMSLYIELTLSPKPGLVTPFDSGSHKDMDANTFLRSIIALHNYFISIAIAGFQGAAFNQLNQLGKRAEVDMMQATNNINTHRGAIFNLGLLSASAATLVNDCNPCPSAEDICNEVAKRWSRDIITLPLNLDSNGQKVARKYGVHGARIEAAAGFPILRNIALPCLRCCIENGLDEKAALTHTLMQLISMVDDTNLLYRKGILGLKFAQQKAQNFITTGGCYNKDWHLQLDSIGHEFVAYNLSPGGSADLLACAWFLLKLERS